MNNERYVRHKAKEKMPITISTAGAEYPVAVNDFSASGMMFSTCEKLNTGQVVEFTFDRANRPFKVNAEILRTQESKSGCNGYGCRFINLSEVMESNLRRYVFSLQLSKPADG